MWVLFLQPLKVLFANKGGADSAAVEITENLNFSAFSSDLLLNNKKGKEQ